MKFSKTLFPMVLVGALALPFAGCNDASVAEKERGERAETLFAEAVRAEQSGDYAAAENLYRALLRKDPANASALLGLAILQQDHRQNFLEAAHNYQAYLDLSPESEKASMVRDRLESARAQLATQLAGEVIAREQRLLTAERDSLRQQLTQREDELAQSKRTLTQRDDQLATLEKRIANLQAIIDQLKTVEAPAPAPAESVDREQLASTEVEAKPEPEDTSSAEIDAIRAMAEEMKNEEDGGVAKRNEETRQAVEGKDDGPKLSDSPKAGHTYLVRPGDTFSKLAREAYGSASGWTRIRDANRSTTNPNGRLRAGETILIP